ncbi:MAG: nucleotidyltransferase domain-containing protein [Microthrixaceae bacterium]|nr:nucleotidyltransferase domain-containing protein [Microthrixaceae bacterium]
MEGSATSRTLATCRTPPCDRCERWSRPTRTRSRRSSRDTTGDPSRSSVSVARGDEQLGSDIDFLVELDPDARPIEILSIGVELEEALGVKVDVGTPTALRERLRDEVLAEALPL